MPLVIAQDYIYQSLRRCGQLRPGYVSSPELMADALNEWQLLFDSWAAQRVMGFSIPSYQYTVTGPGSQTGGNGYQIGPTALDWVGPRPDSVIRANCVLLNTGTQPVYIPLRSITAEEWASLAVKQIPGINVTSLFYYDPQWPNGVFNVFPPLNGNAVQLFTWDALAVPATLGTAYNAPPAYADAVVKCLAARMWPLCTRENMIRKRPEEMLHGEAYEACQVIANVNRAIPRLNSDFRGGRLPDGYYDSFVTYTGLPT